MILAIAGLLGSKYNQNTCTTRQILVSTLVIAWGVRLSAFLFYRILLFKKDRRFDGTRENPCRFLGFWIVQMAWVFIVSLPVLVLNAISNTCHVDVGYIEAIGVTAAGLGLILETWADHTKLIFK